MPSPERDPSEVLRILSHRLSIHRGAQGAGFPSARYGAPEEPPAAYGGPKENSSLPTKEEVMSHHPKV